MASTRILAQSVLLCGLAGAACFDASGLSGGGGEADGGSTALPVTPGTDGGVEAGPPLVGGILLAGGLRATATSDAVDARVGWSMDTLRTRANAGELAPFTSAASTGIHGLITSAQRLGTTTYFTAAAHGAELPYAGSEPFAAFFLRAVVDPVTGAPRFWDTLNGNVGPAPRNSVNIDKPSELKTCVENGRNVLVGAKIFHLGSTSAVDGGLVFASNVVAAPFNTESGALEPFVAVSGVSLGTPRRCFEVVTDDRLLVVLGGTDVQNGSSGPTTVEVARIDRDKGEIGPFAQSTQLPEPVLEAGVTLHAGHLYLAGGRTPGGQIRSTVLRAPIASDGAIGPWQTAPSLPRALAGVALYGSEDTLFAVGGRVSPPPGRTRVQRSELSDVVYSIRVAPDGSLVGQWSSERQPKLPQPASDLEVFPL